MTAFTRRIARLLPALLILAAAAGPAAAQQQPRPARFLGREEILLYGIGLKVEPAQQTVPKNIATIVSTYLQTPTLPDSVPPFAPDAVVKATLRGPSFTGPVELTTKPNTPFTIPALGVPGTHTLENIRLESGGQVILRGNPEQATIEVIERLLVTQVTARPLSAAEIREKGIVFDSSNFQAYNFSAAFAIQDQQVAISFPVVLPSLQGAPDVSVGSVALPSVSTPALPQLKTIIPDTLKLQSQVPNLTVVGFTMKAPDALQGGSFVVPPIPGVIVIPGDIGFLNQYFSVMLMVGNVAPAGSGLDVSDIRAEIVLPAGRDSVVGTDDDPLRMARTTAGEAPRVQLVVQPGPDGKLGTSDDIGVLHPGDSGNAEYLVEGRREGSHVVEMQITGTLHGLPIGPVQVTGRAAGSVLVRNPTFTLTFTHPEAVAAGEPYTLDVTVTNTSESPANFVQLTLYPRNVSGATIIGDPTRSIESIAPGDSSTVSFDLVSRITGKVTAATLDSDDKVAGRFELKTAIGELNVPVSPDSLVLPKEAGSLPKGLRDAALGLLGKAYAVATAPPAALPPDVRRFSRKIVIDRAVEVAEAGLRQTLGEPLPDSAAQLLMDFDGSNIARLPSLVSAQDLPFEQDNYAGFDELRRRSVRGDVFASAVASILGDGLTQQGALAFHYNLAQKWSYRPGHVSVLASASGVSLPVGVAVLDATGRRVGGVDGKGKILKEIPYSDFLPFDTAGTRTAEMALLAAPDPGAYTIRLTPVSTLQPFTLSLVFPLADGSLRQAVFNVAPGQVPSLPSAPGDPYSFTFELSGASIPVDAAAVQTVVDPPPTVMGVVQQKDADVLRCDPAEPGTPVGRVVAVLFSEEVTPASVQDRLAADQVTGFSVDANKVVGVSLQPGRRIAFIALRDPIGPHVARQLTATSATDLRGQGMLPFSGPIQITVGPEGGVVSGRVIKADGTPVPYANVRLFYRLDCGDEPQWVGISSKSADGDGRYSFDYVLRPLPDRIVAVDPETSEFRSVPFNVQRDGQRLNVDIVFLGRGTFTGTTRSESGAILRDTNIRVTSLTDSSQYGATTDADGRFSIQRVPVGNIYVEAINTTVKAKFAFAEAIPFAGAVVDRQITLLDIAQQDVVVHHGTVSGHVLRDTGTAPAGHVPVYVWYTHLSQPGVTCPGNPAPPECAVAGGQTDASGAFSFTDVPSGSLRISAFDQDGLLQGEVRQPLAADGAIDVNVILVGGLGTVTGHVFLPDGTPVQGATVGGGLSLVTTDASGVFTLKDVPVGKRDIIAVSQALGMSGKATVDVTRAGDVVNATIVFDPVGSVSGTVRKSDGVTPASGETVYVFRQIEGSIEVVGQAVTNDQGGYRVDNIRLGEYQVSSFNAGFTEGNLVPAVLKFNGQVYRADVKWRGGNGRVFGTVTTDNGNTPLKARVSISGDRVLIAGGRVAVAFQYVQHFAIADTDFTTGSYSLSGALVGPVTVSAIGQFSPDPIAVEAEIPSTGAAIRVDLRLEPTSQIHGVVMQPDNVHPVGKDVIVHYKSEAFKVICTTNSVTGEDTCTSIPQGIQDETVVTDENGNFTLPLVNAGAFTVSVEDPVTGKIGQIKGLVRAGEHAALSIRLLGLGDLNVQVFQSDTVTPVPNARVVVKQLNYPQKTVQGRADTTGAILFTGADGFSEGEFTIEATDAVGFTGRASARITKDGDQVSVKVYLFDSVGSVVGTLYASDGLTPVPNGELVVSNAAGPLAFTLTDATGGYRVDYVPLGAFRVEAFEAKTARRAAGSGRVDLAGQEVPLNLVQAGIGVVKGTVLDADALSPLKGWSVSLAQRSSSGISLGSLQTTSAIDGSYLFPGTSTGTFSLLARNDQVAGSASASGTIDQEGQVVDVPLLVKFLRPLAGTISGTVYNPDGTPAANSPVGICHPTRPCENPVALTSDGEGRFSLADVPLGRFTVKATSQTTREAGTAQGELAFDGDIASVRVVLGGVSEIRGTVERSNGSPAAGVSVTLTGSPDPGCAGETCTVFTDGSGAFAFVDVPAQTFTITAVDPLNTLLKGAVGGALNPSETRTGLRIVLSPAFTVSGRLLLPGNKPLQGGLADLAVDVDHHLYAQSGPDGVFTFSAAPPGTFQLLLSDPLGSGVATRSVTVAADVALGDILLDTDNPTVAASDPAPASVGVPRNQAIHITFSEPIRPGTINADNVSLSGPSGTVLATLDVSNGDTVVTLTPLATLTDQTRYSVRVRNVQDRFAKPMAADYVFAFTTVDINAPSLVQASPAASTGGAPTESPIRIQFSESIDPARFSGAPIVLAGPTGTVAGRTDYLLGNTTIVFTPNLPLAEDTTYTVTVQRASDLAGNRQASDLVYQFTTTDRTPPQIASLTPANGGNVVENGITSVTADVGTTHDVAVIDWYVNDVLAFASRTSPFTLSLRANTSTYGPAGSTIRIAAIATDTSGNRGTAATTQLTITPDQPPAISILSPADGLSAHTGDRIVVHVRATDDLGVAQIGYRAATGNPGDALTQPQNPAPADITTDFVFYVPDTAVPGATIQVFASAADTKGQVAQASIGLNVLDSVPPVVTITGATSGARVMPGQQTTVVVTAQDVGRIASIKFTASGLVTSTETRPVNPAQPSIVTSFTVTVPTTAHAGQTLILGATATDVAGNSSSAAQVVLPVADTTPPTITLAPENGSLDAVPGRSVNVVATAEDEVGVSRIDLNATGAVTFADSKQVSPPIGSAAKVFSIPVPAAAQPGTQIQVSATATDLTNNTSSPASLVLTVVSGVQVSLPPSAIVRAGQTLDVTLQVSDAAPAGGTRVDLASDDANVASAPTFVMVPEGQTAATVTITGVSGGTTQIRALLAGVPRAAMTVTVSGGIVSGIVRDAQLNPVAGAEVTISGGGPLQSAITDGQGRYEVTGVAGPNVDVRALDPVTRLYGHATAAMARTNGYTTANVILIPAAAIHGTVLDASGTAVGGGVRVDIFAGNDSTVLATTFTADDGSYSFPLVTLGQYRLDASALDGRRGRTTVLLDVSGRDAQVNLTYLGSGTVNGVVKLGTSAVPNAEITFTSTSIFGSAQPIVSSALADGTFTFPNVPIGTFTVLASDPATNRKGVATGTLSLNGQAVDVTVTLAPYGAIEGHVYQSDGTTPVAGAAVTLDQFRTTAADELGHYRFDIVTLGSHSVVASDQGTHGYAQASVQIASQDATGTADLVFVPQGRVLVTVVDAGGTPVPSAFVYVTSTLNGHMDSLNGRTGADGSVLLEHVTAGTLQIAASYGVQYGTTTGSLAAGELKNITVTLSPTGSIAGVVYEADGQTPAAGATVTIPYGVGSSTTGADGAYRIDSLLLGHYDVLVYDSHSRLRALTLDTVASDDLVIDSNGAVATRDFTFAGLGTVTGRVINPDGSSAQNMTVRTWYGAGGLAASQSARTDGGGFYTFQNVLVGPVTVVAADLSIQLYGERSGTLERNGATLTLDVPLTSNAITLPLTLHDANNSSYDVQRDGTIQNGLGGLFYGDLALQRGAMLLDVTSNGSTTRIAGTEVPTIEDGGREIATRQENVSGLSVTRKVFVPRAGYFARYLEIFRNPTSNPITFDVDVTSYGASGTNPRINRTSSGDPILSVTGATPDRWLVSARDADPNSVAFVFDGDGGAASVATASFAVRSGNFRQWGETKYGWHGLTVGPGETVALLHFVAQQLSSTSAIASAQRLVQLPPEALAGLGADEAAAVRNFAMPANGTSTLSPLPSLTGSLTGHVYEYDGTTPVAGAMVSFKSDSVYFGGTLFAAANSDGVFTFTGQLDPDGGAVAIPETAFTLRAVHSLTSIASPSVAGTFDTPGLTAVKNVTFTNSAVITGLVQRHNGTALAQGGVVTVSGTALPSGVSAPIGSDSTFRLTGIPAGDFTIAAQVPHPQGSALRIAQPLHVTAGQPQQLVLTLPPTGAVSGTVRTAGGAPVSGLNVTLSGADNLLRTARTDSGGSYSLTDVPEGQVSLSVTEPLTSIVTTAATTVVRDTTANVELQLVAIGSVRVEVRLSTGAPAVNSLVTVSFATPLGGITRSGNADASGFVTLANVPAGPFTVTAAHPGNSALTVSTIGTITTESTVPVTLTLPPAGSVQVTVTRGNGVLVSGSQVRLSQAGLIDRYLTTDSTGTVTFAGVAGTSFTVRASHPSNTNLTTSAAGTVTGEGVLVPVALSLPPIGTATGTVRLPNNTVLPNVTVTLRSSSGGVGNLVATTDALGVYTITGVPGGPFIVTVEDFTRGVYGTGTSSIDTDLQTVTVNISLLTNVIQLPTTLINGNGFQWDIQRDGDISDGTSDAYDGGLYLRLFSSTTNTTFPSVSSGIVEDAGREVGIRQSNVLGVDVTRKIFVPADGYFARYLEILRNPGTTPITVDVQVESNLGSDSGTNLIATSSGDTVFDAGDRWLVSDDGQDGGGDPALAHVFGGDGARASLSSASLSSDNLRYRWNAITIQPGQTVALMHFAVQQWTRVRAQASAARLVQLPGEALEGLSPDEIAEILNFNVPADGSSALPAIHRPPAGTVNVRVLGGDGVAPVPSASVTIDSTDPIFTSTATLTSGADGRAIFGNVLITPFTLTARYSPAGNLQAPVVTAGFGSGDTTAAVDVPFANAGTIRGTVVRSNGTPATNAVGHIDAPVGATIVDGAFVLPVVQPGSRSVSGAVTSLDQELGYPGIALGTQTATVTVGQATAVTMVLPPLGAISGTVRTAHGDPVTGWTVSVGTPGGSRTTQTDGVGEYAFVNVAVGSYTVSASNPDNGVPMLVNATVADGVTTTADITFPPSGPLTVHVTYPDGSLASTKWVELTGTSYYQSCFTDANGDCTITNVQALMQITVTVHESGFSDVIRATALTALNATADPKTVNVSLPAVATVRVYLKDAAGNPIAGYYVLYTPFYTYYQYYAGPTNADGYADIQLPQGYYYLEAGISSPSVRYTGQITAADHGRLIEVTLRQRIPATITGTVFAGDGATPIPNAYVEALDGDTYLAAAYADAQGAYTFNTSIPVGGFSLRAYAPNGNTFVDVPHAAGQPNETITINPVIPIAVIQGTVTNGDGSPVPYPDVFVITSDQSQTYYASSTTDTGGYVTYVPAGDFVVKAGNGYGIQVSVSVTVPAVTSVMTVNLQMPQTGTVQGTLRRGDGSPVSDEQVTITAPFLVGSVYQYTNSDGTFTFTGVPIGAFTVEGCSYDDQNVCGSASGTLASANSTATIELRLPRLGSVNVTVLDANGSPVPSAQVRLEGVTNRSDSYWAYGNGASIAITGVPEGTMRAVALVGSSYGINNVNVVAGRDTPVTVQIGTATSLPKDLVGTDTFDYDVTCQGRIGHGGIVGTGSSDGEGGYSGGAYNGAFWLTVNGGSFPCMSAGGLAQGGREVILGPTRPNTSYNATGTTTGIATARRVYSPDAGGFVRYYDSFTNRTSVPQSITVTIDGSYSAGSQALLAVAPAATGNTYAVMNEPTATIPVIATVFAGAGAAVPATGVHFAAGDGSFEYSYTLTLAPNQTRALLMFGAQRMPADIAGATSQADALASLTDPLALQGLSAEDLAVIANFVVPGANPATVRHGSVAGRVVAADATTPLPGAAVYAVDVATNRVEAGTSTDATGGFALPDLYAGDSGIRIVAAFGPDAARTADTTVVFASDGDSVSGIQLVLPVGVLSGTVSRGGVAEPNPDVVIRQAGGELTARALSDAAGHYMVLDVAAGDYVVTALDAGATTSISGTVTVPAAAPASATLDLELPDSAPCTPPVVSLAGWWAGEGTAADNVHFGDDGTANAGVSYVPGKVGQAFSFDGTTGVVTIPTTAQLERQLTLEAWVMARNVNPAIPQWFVSRSGTAGDVDLGLAVGPANDNTPRFRFYVGGDGNSTYAESTTIVQPNRFYHVVGTFDGSAMHLFVNGVDERDLPRGASRAVNSAPLLLGRPADTSAGTCDCAVDEVKLYERALTVEEAQNAYASASSGTCGDFTVVTDGVPASFVGQPYTARIRTVGGTAPPTFAIADGSMAPGLAIDASGLISGTPTVAGSYSFVVNATDAASVSQLVGYTQACGTCEASPAGLVSYWSAEDNPRDAVGGRDGAPANITYVAGVAGHAFNFVDSSGVYPHWPAANVHNTFTIEFWANPTGLRLTKPEATSGITGTSLDQQYAVGPEYRGVSSQANAGVSVGTNGISVFEHGPSYMPALLVYDTPVTGWTHIAVVYRNNRPSLYVNGVKVRDGLQSVKDVYVSHSFGNNSFGYGQYHGSLDEIGIYNRALTDAEIAALAAGPVLTRCPVR